MGHLKQVVNKWSKTVSATSAVDVISLNVEVEGVIFLAWNDVLNTLPLQVENGFQTTVMQGLKPNGS